MKSILLVALRQMMKNKAVSVFTILGLATAISCCLMIGLFVSDELNADKHHANYNSIYRVDMLVKNQDEIRKSAGTPFVLSELSKNVLPAVKHMGRMYWRSGQLQIYEKPQIRYQEQQVVFADNDMLKVFSFDYLQGNSDALNNSGSLVITEDMALKYFGRTHVKGEILHYENKLQLTITAVIKNIPPNSDLRFDFLVPLQDVFKAEQPDIADYLKTDWIFAPAWTFCVIEDPLAISAINKHLNATLQKHGDERSKKLLSFDLRKYSTVHLSAADVQGNPSNRTMTFLVVLSFIGFIILLIAGFNFVNLTTARAGLRVREVGVRKVLGAGKTNLVFQFLGETMLVMLVSAIAGFFMARITLPFMNEFTGKSLVWSQMFTPVFFGVFILSLVAVSILCGIYPALLVSRFQTAASLKGKAGESNGKNFLRKTLLTVQFTASVALVICSVIIYRQLDLMRNQPLGYRKNHVVTIPLFGRGASILAYGVDGNMRQKMNAFAAELKSSSRITDVTAASELPGQGFIPGLVIPEGHTEPENIFMPWSSVDYNFLSALEIPLVAGRAFSKETGTDHLSAFIINEKALTAFDCKTAREAIGKSVIRGDAVNGKKGTVIGVVKDFNFNTLDGPVQPLILDVSAARFTQFAVAVSSENIAETISFIEQKWKSFFPERVFEFTFLHDDINRLYTDQENLVNMLGYFTLVAVLLSLIGVLSLSAFLAVQRTKEIGIRKVLGASVASILGLLSRDFFRIGCIGFLLGSLVSFAAMNVWLNDYHYRTTLTWWIFAAAGAGLILLTLLIVCFQSLRIVVAKPSDTLRTE